MRDKGKIVVVSQYYPPDRNTTAAILSKIAEHLAKGNAGSGALRNSRIRVARARVPAFGGRSQELGASESRTHQACCRRDIAHSPDVPGPPDETRAWRCGPHRYGTLCAALWGCCGGKIEAGEIRRDRARSLPGRACRGGSFPHEFTCRKSDAGRELSDVPGPEFDRCDRAGYPTAAFALWR